MCDRKRGRRVFKKIGRGGRRREIGQVEGNREREKGVVKRESGHR